MSVAVHQFVSSLTPHDAVSSHALAVRDVLAGLGFATAIWAKEAWGGMEQHTRPFEEFEPSPAHPTVLLYQASTGSPVGDFLLGRDEPLVVHDHNVTPAAFFSPWEPAVADELELGARQVVALARRAAAVVCDSEFNAERLRAVGVEPVAILAPLIGAGTGAVSPDPWGQRRLAAAKARGGSDWLFVGRLSPNKAQHELLAAFAAHRGLHDPDARLHLVGTSSSWRYFCALRDAVVELGVAGAVSMPGSISDRELAAVWRAADVYVSASRHEGFGLPLVDAMRAGVPVVAVAEAAVPGTVGGAGVLVPAGEPRLLAEAAQRVLTDEPLRRRLVAAGRERAADFAPERLAERYAAVLGDVVGAAVERAA